MRNYIGMGMKRDDTLRICGVSKHQYYNPVKAGGSRGIKPSVSTPWINEAGDLELVDNEKVTDRMISIKSDPNTDYGYRAMTAALMLLGYIINHKKVYRLMKEYQLLHDRYNRTKRTFVKYRRVAPLGPLLVLEMDIKLQWVIGHNRYAFILTIIDCFTRDVLYWTVAYSIKQEQIKQAWESIIINYLQPNDMLKKGIDIEVRNDNDTRFTANLVQEYFKDNHLNQVFTHPYTPQENGHIESFHAILGRSLEGKDFGEINDLEKHLKHFYSTYRNVRLHGSLDHLCPTTFWKLWNQGLIQRIVKKNKSVKFQLKIPHYLISGNGNLREVSSSLEERIKEVVGANSLQQPSVQRSPSVVSS